MLFFFLQGEEDIPSLNLLSGIRLVKCFICILEGVNVTLH